MFCLFILCLARLKNVFANYVYFLSLSEVVLLSKIFENLLVTCLAFDALET